MLQGRAQVRSLIVRNGLADDRRRGVKRTGEQGRDGATCDDLVPIPFLRLCHWSLASQRRQHGLRWRAKFAPARRLSFPFAEPRCRASWSVLQSDARISLLLTLEGAVLAREH